MYVPKSGTKLRIGAQIQIFVQTQREKRNACDQRRRLLLSDVWRCINTLKRSFLTYYISHYSRETWNIFFLFYNFWWSVHKKYSYTAGIGYSFWWAIENRRTINSIAGNREVNQITSNIPLWFPWTILMNLFKIIISRRKPHNKNPISKKKNVCPLVNSTPVLFKTKRRGRNSKFDTPLP